MSRRRLEAAIQAGKAIEEGSDLPESRDYRVSVYHTHEFDNVQGGVFSLQYTHDGNKLVVGYGDGGIEVLSSATGEKKREIRHHRPTGLAITCLRFHPEEQHLCYAASAEGLICICSIVHAGASSRYVSETNNEVNCLDFNLNGSRFATGGRDLSIRLYDAGTNQLVHTYEGYDYFSAEQPDISGHARRIFALKFHPDEKDVFISGGWDNHLKIWDTRTQDGVQRVINGPHICGDGLDIKGSQLLTGSWVTKNALQLWDYGSGQLIQNIPITAPNKNGLGGTEDSKDFIKKGEYLYCAQFADDDLIFAGGTGTNSAVLISSKSCQTVAEVNFGKSVQALDSTSGGRLLALGGAAGKLILAKMS